MASVWYHNGRTQLKEHAFDVIIFTTGFDAVTGSPFKPRITGRDGRTLREKWDAGSVTQLDSLVSDFPNMLIVVEPSSPSLLSNVLLATDEHTDWLVTLIRKMGTEQLTAFEAEPKAERGWTERVNEWARQTFCMNADSCYIDTEIGGEPRVLMSYSGGVRGYRRPLQKCADEGYSGFALCRPTPVKAERS